MKMFTAIAILVLSALPTFGQSARGNPDMSFGGETVDSMIAAYMKKHDVPGMAVAIVQAPYITRVTGYGVSDKDRQTLVSAATMFNVGQMRNAFTAVAIVQLVEEGQIKLEDVRNELRTADPSLERLVEKASGIPYEEFIRNHQFKRIGLEQTFFGADLPRVPHESVAAGERHKRFLEDPTLIHPTEPATGYAADRIAKADPRAIYASAHDISVWDIALAGDILIKRAELRKVLYIPGDAEQVGAWNFPGHPGLMVTTGSQNGFSSLLSRYTAPSELVCVTLLANKEGLNLKELAARIAAAHNAKLAPK